MRCMKFSGAKRTRTSLARGSAARTSKKQGSDCSNPHPPTPPLTRHQHQLQIQQQQQQQQQRGGANKLLSHAAPGCVPLPPPPGGGGALLSSICGPKPTQCESRMPGRHPHPPSGNNSKLKHK
ncbi:hypothetical protein GBAR_LOCUS18211, partial [Geodia barretti]